MEFLKIKSIRKELKLSQTDICQKIGICQSSFSALERGLVKNPSPETISKIEKCLSELNNVHLQETILKEE